MRTPSVLAGLSDWQLHRLKARAYLFSCAPDACLTGCSAALTWDFPTVGAPPDVPVVVRPKAQSRGPMPVCNAWVGSSGPVYRVDGLWPFHRSAYEADGALKYDNRPDASSIVAAQSEREFYLRRLGLDVARYGWDLGFRRRATLALHFSALLRDNPVRAEPIQWVEARARCRPGQA